MASRVEQIANMIENDVNPIIAFSDTYDVHDILKERGYFKTTLEDIYCSLVNRIVRRAYCVTASCTFRYRVDHGNGCITQNTWYNNQICPEMIEIKNEK